MHGIFTLPEYRNKGYAEACIKNLILKAQKVGVDFIHLDGYNKALPLYERAGFSYQGNHEKRMFYFCY